MPRPLLLVVALALRLAAVEADPPLAGQAFEALPSGDGIVRIELEDAGLRLVRGPDEPELMIPVSERREGAARILSGRSADAGIGVEARIAGEDLALIIEEAGAKRGPLPGKRAGARGDAATALALARLAGETRGPAAAIPRLVALIEGERDAVSVTGPALVHLVACFQRLKGDAAQAKRYIEIAAKYLTTPPPLDGTSTVTLEQAQDDLLWKSWKPGEALRYRATIGDRSRSRSLSKDGQRQEQLSIQIEIAGDGPVPRSTAGHGDDDEERPTLTAHAGGTTYRSEQLWLHGSGDDHLQAQVQFHGIPDGLRSFDLLEGGVPLALPRETRQQRIPLRQGGTWEMQVAEGVIESVAQKGDGFEVTFKLSYRERNARVWRQLSLHGDDAPFTLLGADGKPVQTGSTSMRGSGEGATCTYGCREEPTTLLVREVLSESTKVLPIRLERVELP